MSVRVQVPTSLMPELQAAGIHVATRFIVATISHQVRADELASKHLNDTYALLERALDRPPTLAELDRALAPPHVQHTCQVCSITWE